MRARRGECVCPRFPLPSPPVLRPDGAASGSQKAAAAGVLHWPARRERCALGGPGAEEQRRPRARARVPAPCAPGSERDAERAVCAAAAAARGGCRPRPPAAQALPLFSPPPCSIPARPARKPDRFAAAAAGASAAVGLGARVGAWGRGALSRRRVPSTESRAGQGPEVWPVSPRLAEGFPGALKSCSPANESRVWDRASSFPQATELCSASSPAHWTLPRNQHLSTGAPSIGKGQLRFRGDGVPLSNDSRSSQEVRPTQQVG